MTIIRTERTNVLWTPEASYGVWPGWSGYSGRFGIHDTIVVPDPEIAWRPVWDVGHTSRSRRTALPGKWTLRGSVPDILLQPTIRARMLMGMALGQHGLGSVNEGMTSTDERLPSFSTSIVYHDTSNAGVLGRTFTGCKIGRASWSAREGEELRFSIDEFIAQTVLASVPGIADRTPGDDAIYGIENFDYGEVNVLGPSDAGRYMFSGADIVVTIGGSALHLAHTRSFHLTVDNQLDPKYYLNRADSGGFTQILSQIVEGKRTYTCDVDVDLQDPSTDLALWAFLLNQGAPGGVGKPVGCSITAAFETEFAEGDVYDQLVLGCDGAPTTTAVGAVLKSAMHGVPAPPAGLVPVSLAFDVGHVGIISPV